MRPGNRGRIVFDLSTSMRWMGPPAGIVRVERKLAAWAYANIPGTVFAFFDPARSAFCELTRDAGEFLAGEAAVDTLGLTNAAQPGQRRTDRAPAALKPLLLWTTQTRRIALNHLERLRLRTKRQALAQWADRLQRMSMSDKYRRFMVRADDTRRPLYPCDLAVGAPVDLTPDDTLVCAGYGWEHTNIAAISEQKARIGFRLVVLCYDLIPLVFPQFYRGRDVELFGRYVDTALRIADRVVVNSHSVEADCRRYCAQRGSLCGEIVVAPLGFDIGSGRVGSKLPRGLSAGRFAMMVSTIEPRKGHRLLYDVWRRLVAEGVPQKQGYKLVFAGRPGWMVEGLLADIRNDASMGDQIIMIDDADDATLDALYAGAAFCLYPSRYEGYGLPVVEAFAHRKAVLCSTAGALAELARDFSPCLDATDEEVWYATIKEWVLRPEARAPYEREIAARFNHPTWTEAAANFFRLVADVVAEQPSAE